VRYKIPRQYKTTGKIIFVFFFLNLIYFRIV
jgi:hypothetical protein